MNVFWAVWAFLSFSVVDSSDVSLQTTWREVFGAQGALYFNAMTNISNVLLKIRCMDNLRTKGAMFAHIIVNFFDVSCQLVEIFLFHIEGTFP